MKSRPYSRADAPVLADLYARSVRHYGPRAYDAEQVEAWASTASAQGIESRYGDGRFALIAEDFCGQVMGFGDIEANGHLDMLYAAPEAEGKAVGALLYKALEDHALQQSIPSIQVEASEVARRFFERHHFRLVHRNALMIGNVAIHNYSMEKVLI